MKIAYSYVSEDGTEKDRISEIIDYCYDRETESVCFVLLAGCLVVVEDVSPQTAEQYKKALFEKDRLDLQGSDLKLSIHPIISADNGEDEDEYDLFEGMAFPNCDGDCENCSEKSCGFDDERPVNRPRFYGTQGDLADRGEGSGKQPAPVIQIHGGSRGKKPDSGKNGNGGRK